MTIYLIFAIIGAFVLLISVFGGDHHLELATDAHDIHDGDSSTDNDSPKVLSLRTLASFLLAFGVAGIICVYLDKSVGAQITWGFIAGFLMVGLVYGIMRVFYSQQGYSTFDVTALIGSNCSVIIGSTLSGIASVRVLTPDGAKEYTCKEINNNKLERNDVVTIKAVQDSTLIVSKIVIDLSVLSPAEAALIKEGAFDKFSPPVTKPEPVVSFVEREIHTEKTEAIKKKAATKKPAAKKPAAKKPSAKKPTAAKKFGPKLDDLPK